MAHPKDPSTPAFALPPDDLSRTLTLARADAGNVPHVGVAGGVYTVLLTGENTAGKFCLIDMFVAPGGGPAPHRHDFEETFTMLEGELEVTFRGTKQTLRAGDTANIPANAPHQFKNLSEAPARILCFCSPAGLDEFFLTVGVPVPDRTTLPPKPSEEEAAAFRERAAALAPKYKTEILTSA